VPQGWEWARLGMICPYGENKAISSNLIDESSWILDLEDIERDTGIIKYHATKIERNSVSNKYAFTSGQLLYSKLRPYLNKVVVAEADGYCTTEILPLTFYGNISVLYMQLYLMSPTFLKYVNIVSYGVKMPRLGTTDGKNSLIAVPPLHEQLRIREQFDVIALLIRKIDKYTESLHNDVSELKSKILDLAIKGRLVPQDPNDEPSSVLLERIKKEKEELIKSGKLKRDKKESVIFKGDDNSYYAMIDGSPINISEHLRFELPSGWSWITLSDIACVTSGKTPKPEQISDCGDVPYFKVSDMNTQGNELYLQYTDSYVNNLYSGPIFEEGSFVFPKNGGAVLTNKKRILTQTSVVDLNTGVFTTSCLLNPDFAFYLFTSIDFSKIHKGAVIPTVDSSVIGNLIYGLPPIEEQKRIAATIKTIFLNLSQIKNASS
jgi:type I restriction-modification enzyme S subunit